jgi:hypothetical protein
MNQRPVRRAVNYADADSVGVYATVHLSRFGWSLVPA